MPPIEIDDDYDSGDSIAAVRAVVRPPTWREDAGKISYGLKRVTRLVEQLGRDIQSLQLQAEVRNVETRAHRDAIHKECELVGRRLDLAEKEIGRIFGVERQIATMSDDDMMAARKARKDSAAAGGAVGLLVSLLAALIQTTIEWGSR